MIMSYVVWDVETTTEAYKKRKASPFLASNHVVASGWYRSGTSTNEYVYFGREKPKGEWFRQLLVGTQVLVGFNIKFDLLHALQDPENRAAWMAYVGRGGTVWDCQLAEYLLLGMRQDSHMLSLDEVAPKYGGDLKNDEVKALWKDGVDTPDIDKKMLLDYLIGAGGDDGGDIGNTHKIYLGQIEALTARGSLPSAQLNMASLVCSTEMELNGMRVDREVGLEHARGLVRELEDLNIRLDKELPEDLPFVFNWGSTRQLSALIFGGSVSYTAREPLVDDKGAMIYPQTKVKHYLLSGGGTTSTPPEASTEEGYVKFKAGKNAGEFKTKLVMVPDREKGPKTKIYTKYWKFPGYIKPEVEWETATEGVYSTSSSVLMELGGRGVTFLDGLSERASLKKDLTAYYISTDPKTGEEKGMLTLVGEDGCIHHAINHTSTVTGRFSSSNPNLQNIPKASKSRVKELFVSRFEGGKIIQSDFSSLEIYVQANLTKDPTLIADLKAGIDLHSVRCAATYNVSYEYVRRMLKEETDHVWSARRTAAKIFSFQRAYGAGNSKIAKTTRLDLELVEQMAKAEDERYAMINAFYEALTEDIKNSRTVTNRHVQHPEYPGLTCNLGEALHNTPDGKFYSYSEEPAPRWSIDRGGPLQSFRPTQIRNYCVQGAGAEVAKAAMALAVVCFSLKKNFGGKALLVNQVHDALYVDTHPEVADEAAALLHACMLEASAYISYITKWELLIPVPTETQAGPNMLDECVVTEDVIRLAEQKRKGIRKLLMPNFRPHYEVTNDV